MTTDLLITGPRQPASTAARSGFARGRKKPGLSHDLITGTAALLKTHALEAEGWTRKISALLAHLKHIQTQLAAAENRLADQEKRISLLQDLATTDELTGLKNRRGFYEGFTRELECCDRGISKGGLIVMIDLDNFKSINDNFGHQAGDAVLRLVGKTLSGDIRRMDVAARLGGDEFVLLMSNTTQAAARAQLIGWHLNNLSLAWYGDVIPVRASIGLKAFGAGDTADTVLRAADGTLYATKFERKQSGAEPRPGGPVTTSP